MAYRAGGKMTGKHGRTLQSAAPIVDAALRHPDVKKVRVGPINRGGINNNLSITTIGLGLKVTVKGNHSVQVIFVYTKEPEKVTRYLYSKY